VILTLGDSVTWGQGLLDTHKFDRLYAGQSLLPRLAHSGAIIGAETDSSNQKEYPELPVPYPSLWQQITAVTDWSDVDLVIVNGGINDVSLTRILNPWIAADHISDLTRQFCQGEMTKLLGRLASKLVKPGARIAVVGYYPILSGESNFENEKQPRILMEMNGVATSSAAIERTFDVTTLVPQIVTNCLAFWTASTVSLKAAVDKVNADLGVTKCSFVDTTFSETNALWAADPLLWELSATLDAEDEVTELRDRACDARYGDLAHIPEWGQWYQCDRASVGHPNVRGAARVAVALEDTLTALS
jgi:lysophospholipase L1-like esterase